MIYYDIDNKRYTQGLKEVQKGSYFFSGNRFTYYSFISLIINYWAR